MKSKVKFILDDNKDLGCNIFENKIKRLSDGQKVMEQQEFLDYFSQNVSNVKTVSYTEITF